MLIITGYPIWIQIWLFIQLVIPSQKFHDYHYQIIVLVIPWSLL